MRGDVGDAGALEAVRACGLHPRASRRVDAYRHAELLTRSPQRVVGSVMPGAAVEDVWSEEERFHPELGDRTAQLDDGARHIVRRYHRGAAHPARIAGLDEIVQPVV